MIGLNEVFLQTGLSKRVVYRLIECERFPRPIKIEGQADVWAESDIDDWKDRKRREYREAEWEERDRKEQEELEREA